MKAALILGIIAAALAGALLVTVLDTDDDAAELVAAAPASTEQQVAAGGVAEAAPERPSRAPRPAPGGGGAAVFVEPDDRPIGQAELDRVRDAAIAAVGGGIVTDIDRSDDLGIAYEVEVVQDAQEIDVHLDGELALVAQDYED